GRGTADRLLGSHLCASACVPKVASKARWELGRGRGGPRAGASLDEARRAWPTPLPDGKLRVVARQCDATRYGEYGCSSTTRVRLLGEACEDGRLAPVVFARALARRRPVDPPGARGACLAHARLPSSLHQ